MLFIQTAAIALRAAGWMWTFQTAANGMHIGQAGVWLVMNLQIQVMLAGKHSGNRYDAAVPLYASMLLIPLYRYMLQCC